MCYGAVGTPNLEDLYFIGYTKDEVGFIKELIELPKQRFNSIYQNALKKSTKGRKKTLRCCRMVNDETRDILEPFHASDENYALTA